MDLEKRMNQLESKMRQMELELNELRQARRREGQPAPEQPGQAPQPGGHPAQAGAPAAGPMPHRPAPPQSVPGFQAPPGQGMYGGQTPPPHGRQGYPPSYGQGMPGYPPPGAPGQGYQGQMPPVQPQYQTAERPYPQGMNPYAYPPQHANIPREPKPPKDWEHLIARVWLPRVFIVVLLLGVLWGFTAAVKAGYLTEPVRCLLGVAVSAAMYWLGERQIRSKREALGQVLLGGSIGILILSVFAAHQLYDLIPSGIAFALYVLSIALCVFTALRRRSQALIIIATVAGYLIPFLVHSAQPNAWVFGGYEAAFSLAMIAVSLKFDFRAAYFVAVGVLHLPLLIGYAAGDFGESRHVFIGAVFVQHAALLAYALFGPGRRKLDETLSLFPGFGIMALWIYALYPISEGAVHWRPLMLLVWALIYTLSAWGKYMKEQRSPVLVSIATAAWFLWALDLLNESYSPSAAVVIGTAGIILGFRLNTVMQQITAAIVFAYGAAGTLFLVIDRVFSAESLSWLILLAAFAILAYVLRRMPERIFSSRLPDLCMWIDALLAIIFLTELTNVLTDGLAKDLRHLILSAVWAVYAIAVIVGGLALQRQMVRFAGIGLLFLTLIKVIIADLPDVSVAVRAILFIGLGAIGIVVSRLMYKRKNAPAQAAPEDTAVEP
ncbi:MULTISPECIES: DUF2339 domain-containing protein [Paenibacillus]|uniref:DUF2339 domain-containing protein n=1 Tax=Paenibacillus albilobatus TaxID=2716884 RepID=A0A919XKJ1_9BACL|nr:MULTISPECIES: DUF2339 domain-containing protein [Paenibacillus]GIO33901.1 hypothetical protein J2TS6_50420 [Paenibacillus albilobatus]